MKITLPALAVTALIISSNANAGYVAPITHHHHHGAHCPILVQYVQLSQRDAIIRHQMNSVRGQRQARSQLIQLKAKLVRNQRILRNHRVHVARFHSGHMHH